MTPEDEHLLLRDLCARIPYGVRYKGDGGWGINPYQHTTSLCTILTSEEPLVYLRPMSSMTEEEKEYIKHRWCYNDWDIDGPSSLWREKIDVEDAEGIVDYFNEHHLDFRGLIPMGLALEAPADMYKN